MRPCAACDGKIIPALQEAAEGGYVVTAPLDPQLIRGPETAVEAFENAGDVLAPAADHEPGDIVFRI
jgi:hypothetical protein